MTFKPKIKSLSDQDLKEVSINYLKSVIKNSNDNQIIIKCLKEIKLRTTSTFFDGSKHIEI